MPWYGWHGWWMGWMWAFWIILIVFMGWLVLRVGSRPRDVQQERRTPEEILRERFARGEIDTEEFQRRIEVLRSRNKVA